MGEPMQPDCILHEEKLKEIEKKLQAILDKDNDFYVKVINGTTQKRLASELLGELYVNMKELQRQTPSNMWKNFGGWLLPLVNLAAILGVILTLVLK